MGIEELDMYNLNTGWSGSVVIDHGANTDIFTCSTITLLNYGLLATRLRLLFLSICFCLLSLSTCLTPSKIYVLFTL